MVSRVDTVKIARRNVTMTPKKLPKIVQQTVQSVYKDNPWEKGKLVFDERWSLFGGPVLEAHYKTSSQFDKNMVSSHVV